MFSVFLAFIYVNKVIEVHNKDTSHACGCEISKFEILVKFFSSNKGMMKVQARS